MYLPSIQNTKNATVCIFNIFKKNFTNFDQKVEED